MKPCASCRQMIPVRQLVRECACGRETCVHCLIPILDSANAGPRTITGYICQQCAGQRLRAALVEVLVTAALAGHNLAPFAEVKGSGAGYQAACRCCGQPVWLGAQGQIRSRLEEGCPGAGKS